MLKTREAVPRMPKKQHKRLDPNIKSEAEEELAGSLRHLIVGQERAIEVLVDAHETFRAGLAPPDHPVGNLIFLGPTGCGKTYIMKIITDAFRPKMKLVNCRKVASEFSIKGDEGIEKYIGTFWHCSWRVFR